MGRRHEEDAEEIGAAAAKAPARRRSNPSMDNNNNNNNNNSIYHPPAIIGQKAANETPYGRYAAPDEPAPPPPHAKRIPGQDTQQASGSAPVATRRGNEVSHQISAARLNRSIDVMEDDGDNHSENNSTIMSNSDLPGAFNVEGNIAHPVDDGTIQYSMGGDVGEMSRRRAESPPPEEEVGITENRNLVVAELAPTTIKGTAVRMEDGQQQPPSSGSYKKFVILLLSAILVCVVTGVIVVIILLVPSDDEGTAAPTIVTSTTVTTSTTDKPSVATANPPMIAPPPLPTTTTSPTPPSSAPTRLAPSSTPSTSPSRLAPSSTPSTSPSTQPSTMPSPGPSSEEYIGLVEGARMTLFGTDNLSASSIDEWETLTAEFTDLFWSENDDVNLITTALNVTQVISNRRHLKGRALEDFDDESVTLVYSQGFIYETDTPDLVSPRLMASSPFATEQNRVEYTVRLVGSDDPGLVNIVEVSNVIFPMEPSVTNPPSPPPTTTPPSLSPPPTTPSAPTFSALSSTPSTSPSTSPSTMPSPGPSTSEFIGLVEGAEMTLYGIDDLGSSFIDEWESLTAEFTDMFWSGNEDVDLITTALNVKQVISNRRHLKGRALEDFDDESVTVVYDQGFIYETDSPGLIGPRFLASLPFSTQNTREEYVDMLVASEEEGLVNITESSAVTLPAEPDVR